MQKQFLDLQKKTIVVCTFIIAAILYKYVISDSYIYKVFVCNNANETAIKIKHIGKITPLVTFNKEEQCWFIDFKKTKLITSLLNETITGTFIKMAFFSYPNQVKTNARLRIYTKNNTVLNLKKSSGKLIISIKKAASYKYHYATPPKLNKELLNPTDKHLSPVFINIQNNSIKPALLALAESAGIKLRILTDLPLKTTLKIEASTPMEALCGIIKLLDLKVKKYKKNWTISLGKTTQQNVQKKQF